MDLARFEKRTAYSWNGQFAPSKYGFTCMSEGIPRVKGNEIRLAYTPAYVVTGIRVCLLYHYYTFLNNAQRSDRRLPQIPLFLVASDSSIPCPITLRNVVNVSTEITRIKLCRHPFELMI
jgi:hypothetical protein